MTNYAFQAKVHQHKGQSTKASGETRVQWVGGRLQRSFLHHAHVEASLIPAEEKKKNNLDNEVQ